MGCFAIPQWVRFEGPGRCWSDDWHTPYAPVHPTNVQWDSSHNPSPDSSTSCWLHQLKRTWRHAAVSCGPQYGPRFLSPDYSKRLRIVAALTCPRNPWVFLAVAAAERKQSLRLLMMTMRSCLRVVTLGCPVLYLSLTLPVTLCRSCCLPIILWWTLKLAATRLWLIPASKIPMARFRSSGDNLGMVLQYGSERPYDKNLFFFLQEGF